MIEVQWCNEYGPAATWCSFMVISLCRLMYQRFGGLVLFGVELVHGDVLVC